MNIIETKALGFRRNDRWILRDIDWTVEPGQHWTLLGANGSGKTTLLKILTGYEWATTGSVEVLGKRFGTYDLRELRKVIGWVSIALGQRIRSQETGLNIVLSGLDATLGTYRSFTTVEHSHAESALTNLGIEELAGTPFGVLSQGEQQRLLIARALVHHPALLVLDEPCAGLDPAARERFLQTLSGFAKQETAPSMLLVTHHVEEIGPWITHGLVLKEGRILANGGLTDVLDNGVISAMLDTPCTLHHSDNGYSLRMNS